MQPNRDIDELNFLPDRFDDKRLNYLYPWQQLINRGLMILGGFDAPIKMGNPQIKFYAATTRERLDEILGEKWYPRLVVNHKTTLTMLTIWPVYGAFQKSIHGSTEVRRYTSFRVFDKNWPTVPKTEMLTPRSSVT
jgi:hypothetical protein